MKLDQKPSADARSCISRATAISGRPSGTSFSLPVFSAGGISSNRSSMFDAPMAPSMAETSSSVWGMKGMLEPCYPQMTLRAFRRLKSMGFGLDQLLVGRGVEQFGDVGRVGRLHLEHPGGVGVLVHRLGAGLDVAVGGDHFAGDRGIDVGRG